MLAPALDELSSGGTFRIKSLILIICVLESNEERKASVNNNLGKFSSNRYFILTKI